MADSLSREAARTIVFYFMEVAMGRILKSALLAVAIGYFTGQLIMLRAQRR